VLFFAVKQEGEMLLKNVTDLVFLLSFGDWRVAAI
jgi:hypothetical protein